jgi:ABC-type nitrate/sulfonate/bicarbonate transport system substrate-binding protein
MDKIRLGYAAKAGGTAPVWTAYEAGIFRELDIDLELALIPGSKQVSAAIDGGDIQLANFASPAAVQRDLQLGSDQIVVMGIMNSLIQTISGRPGVDSLEQLRGGKIGTPGLEEVDFRILTAVLPRIGFHPGRDIEVVDVGRGGHDRKWLTPNLGVDALVLHPPDPSDAEDAGWKVLLDMRDLKLPFQLACITGKRSWISDHRDLVQRYVQGHVEGIYRFKQDPEFALKVLKIYSSTDDESVLRRGYGVLCEVFSERPYPSVEAIGNVISTFNGIIPGAESARPDQFIDDSFMAELDRSGELAKLRTKYGLQPVGG